MLFTLFIGHWLPPEHQPNTEHGAHGDVYDKPFYVRFRRLVEWCLDHRKTVLAATLTAFCAVAGVLQLFCSSSSSRPPAGRSCWWISGCRKAPVISHRNRGQTAGNPAQERRADCLHHQLCRRRLAALYLPLDQQQQHLNYAQMMIMTRDEQVRDEVKHKIAELFDQGFPAVRGSGDPPGNGPPVGYPVQFRLLGPTLASCAPSASAWKPCGVNTGHPPGEQRLGRELR